MTLQPDRDEMTAPDRLVRIVAQRRSKTSPPISLEPASTYEAVTRQMVDDLTRELTGLRTRLDSIFYIVVGSILVDILVRLVG